MAMGRYSSRGCHNERIRARAISVKPPPMLVGQNGKRQEELLVGREGC
jgi:hypothetical protein